MELRLRHQYPETFHEETYKLKIKKSKLKKLSKVTESIPIAIGTTQGTLNRITGAGNIKLQTTNLKPLLPRIPSFQTSQFVGLLFPQQVSVLILSAQVSNDFLLFPLTGYNPNVRRHPVRELFHRSIQISTCDLQ